MEQFVTNMATLFHVSETWALLNFLALQMGALRELDVSRTLKKYLSATVLFQASERVFIIPSGKNTKE